MTRPQGGVKGGRSHGGDLTGTTLGTADGDDTGDGDPGGADMMKSPYDTADTGDRGGAVAKSI
ncbi:hypothetical protein DPX16_22444 [Anabarilius grahami]|uniref:Uncharacterized protein n=1 Tax=Anabarilius grahami TaxID=495550 RepID=A0A3N0Z0C2_ANAGA|nr:hypothetical protein DPX16_22444 [Anabarilius grahami]